jgi:pimeloyl-ACP methyl ester carboxylesterase
MLKLKNVLLVKYLICLLLILIMTSVYSQVNDQYTYETKNVLPKREKMIDVGNGRSLSCTIYGHGAPTVILVTGFKSPQSNWDPVLPYLIDKVTVITYDRPGVGKSIQGHLPMDGGQSAKDLHILLQKLELPKPYLLVGHSIGVDIVRLYTALYPDEVKGLILEDGSHESILEEQMKVLKGDDLETLKRMAARMSQVENPQNEAEYKDVTNDLLRNHGPLPHIPFVVITSGDRVKALPPVFSSDGQQALIELGMKLQQRLVDLIPGGKHIVAEGVGHNIHIEKPEILVKPILDMLKEINLIK